MDLISIGMLCGGLAFFLFGIHVLSSALAALAGGRLERALRNLTDSAWKGLLLGTGITAAMQSSSALTVMLVGLVDCGILDLPQTVGLIMGSNIGTTLTPWLLCLTGGGTPAQPVWALSILALAGAVLLTASGRARGQQAGAVFCGLAVLLYGLKLMQDAAAPLAEVPAFRAMLLRLRHPILGVLAGAAFTGFLQSSAASVGILQALSRAGTVTYGMAVPIIMGQNIGTCVTALLASVGAGRNARRVAALHGSFNVLGTALCLTAFYGLNMLFHFPVSRPITPVAVAGVHSMFNIVTAAVLLPASGKLMELAGVPAPDRTRRYIPTK